MSHEIESVMYVGETPWYGFGNYVGEEEIDSKEAIIAAGLDWLVEKRPLYTGREEDDEVQLVTTHQSICRVTDDKILGIVGNRYQPVQNHESFEFMDALVESGEMRYHTAGSLRGGQRIWLLGKIGSSEIVKNDQIDRFLFLWNSHDGSGSLRCLFTQVRVVCANTARAALSQGKGEGVCLRHTTNIKNKLEKARKILGLANEEFDAYDSFMQDLAKMGMTSEMWNNYSLSLIPDPEEGKNTTRAENQREVLTELFESGVGQDIPGVAGTGWAAHCATVEYINYHRGSRGGEAAQERRFESSLFGSGNNLAQKSVETLMDMDA